jgi:ABC-2 type transport system ATP-binding protein
MKIEAIEVKNLSKHFFPSMKERKRNRMQQEGSEKGAKNNIIQAVNDINFNVKQGEIFGFLGPNGAGKTTTIRMLTGVLKPTNGSISIFGGNIWKHPIVVKQILGHVPEEANVYMDLTGTQNLYLIGKLYGISKSERVNRAENLLKQFELFEKGNLKAKKYSKGMKQRLLLCMALMSNPEILFLDEPTSGLDVKSSRIIKKLIKEYNENGMTIFITTHDMDVANELCHRIAIINQGKIISLDTPENLKKLTKEYLAIDCHFTDTVNVNEIKKLPSIIEVQQNNSQCHIIVKDINVALIEIVDFIKNNDLNVKQVSTNEPKLEDAFLKIIERGVEN